MLKSMTGFGRGEYEDEKFSATVEMKTVNHRYNEVAIRLPRFLNPLEDRIRKTILRSINRGRIVGRKLDFLVQEFNREANTIASKANDYTIAQLVVDIKAEIEKIREQIQNIE